LHQRRSFQSGEYDEEVFSAYVARIFGEVFEPELAFVDSEIAKYEPKDVIKKIDEVGEFDLSSVKPKRVEAFITKNHTSAHARATAGVCVSGDNPQTDENGIVQPNIWQMPNYLHMILRDGDTKLCKGCVLLHIEEDNGKKILTASMNPSSTYLFQVNEEEMFKNLREQLIVFAKDNNVDAIAVSTNKQIRTNRTGGLFERAMERSIADVKKEHSLSTPHAFSHHPNYQQKDLDFIWMADPSLFVVSA